MYVFPRVLRQPLSCQHICVVICVVICFKKPLCDMCCFVVVSVVFMNGFVLLVVMILPRCLSNVFVRVVFAWDHIGFEWFYHVRRRPRWPIQKDVARFKLAGGTGPEIFVNVSTAPDNVFVRVVFEFRSSFLATCFITFSQFPNSESQLETTTHMFLNYTYISYSCFVWLCVCAFDVVIVVFVL
jgi:hypothetical protein